MPLPPLQASQTAAQSLAQARKNREPRTPPIQRDTETSHKPKAAELADPVAYQRFETRQNAQVLPPFARAAATRRHCARCAGIAPEDIAKAEEKLRRIEEMRTKQLAEHPELAR